MAVSVKSVHQTYPEGAGGSWDHLQGDEQSQVVYTYVVIFNETGNEATEGTPNERAGKAIYADDGTTAIPAKGSRPTSDVTSPFYNTFARNFVVMPTANLFVFLVEVTFENETRDWQPNQYPWDGDWDVSFPTRTERKFLTKTLTAAAGTDTDTEYIAADKDIANAVGTPYDPEVASVPEYPTVIQLVKSFENIGSWVDDLIFRGSINSADITVGGVSITTHYGRITGLSISPAYYEGTKYWVITVTIEVSEEPQYLKLQNRGAYYMDANDKEVYKLDAQKRRKQTPSWLKKDGTDFAGDTEIPNYRAFCPFKEMNWGSLGLPTSENG